MGAGVGSEGARHVDVGRVVLDEEAAGRARNEAMLGGDTAVVVVLGAEPVVPGGHDEETTLTT